MADEAEVLDNLAVVEDAPGTVPTSVLKVPVTKGKGIVEINTDELPDEVYREALLLGLKELANRGMSKLTKASTKGDEAKLKALAMEQAAQNVDAIKAGKIRFSGAKVKSSVSREVTTEATRLAKNVVKDEIKKAGQKISHYAASEITKAAKALLEADASYFKMAEENLAKRTAAPVKLNISGLIKADPKLVAKAEKDKADRKAQLSAKQAGKTATRQKPGARA